VQITPLWVSVTSTPPCVYNCDPTCLLLLPVSSPLPGARFEFLSFEMPHPSVPSYLMSSVHFCACGYWRVKLESNTRDQLDAFLASRNADPEVGMRPQPGPQPQLAGKGMMWDSRRRGIGEDRQHSFEPVAPIVFTLSSHRQDLASCAHTQC
jgi:hypothetical protein